MKDGIKYEFETDGIADNIQMQQALDLHDIKSSTPQQQFEELQEKVLSKETLLVLQALGILHIDYKDRQNYVVWKKWDELTSQQQQAFLNLCIERTDELTIKEPDTTYRVIYPTSDPYDPDGVSYKESLAFEITRLCLEGKHDEALALIFQIKEYLK